MECSHAKNKILIKKLIDSCVEEERDTEFRTKYKNKEFEGSLYASGG